MSDERRRRLEQISRAASDAREVREAVVEEEAEEQPRMKRPPAFNTLAYESWIDQQIRRAQERGAFDNLRGTGQPLAEDDQNVAAFAGDDAMGLKLLKNNEALPAWIELNKEIAGDRAACRRILDYYVAEQNRDRRARFADDYRRRVRDLNLKIDQYNLIVPARHLEQIRVRPELELRDADQRRWARLDETK
jgi:DnaJ family protein C protein 28